RNPGSALRDELEGGILVHLEHTRPKIVVPQFLIALERLEIDSQLRAGGDRPVWRNNQTARDRVGPADRIASEAEAGQLLGHPISSLGLDDVELHRFGGVE